MFRREDTLAVLGVQQQKSQITIKALKKVFESAAGTVTALGPIDLTIGRGDFFVTVGPSGCGKTTLLRILAGLEKQTEGTVELATTNGVRPRRAMVLQEESIFPWMTVRENVGYGLKMQGGPRAERDKIVDQWIEKVGLTRFHKHFPYQLSGGMKQRVSLARAFAVDPDILLMDEPFSALDEQNKMILQQELLRIWDETRKTVIFITHSIDEALTLGDRVMVMTASPGQSKSIIPVPFPRPRQIMDLRTNHVYGEMVAQVWNSLHDEVEKASNKEGRR